MGSLDYNGFTAIFHRYYRRLTAYASRYVVSQHDAEDIVQGVFVKLWQMHGAYSDVPAGRLLFTMVRNSCLDYLKHSLVINRFEKDFLDERQRENESIWDFDFFGDENPDNLYQDLHRALIKEMDKLPDKCREAFRMSRLDGLSNHEISEVMGISDAAVHKHIARAVEKLSSSLKNGWSKNGKVK